MPHPWLQQIVNAPALDALCARLSSGRSVPVEGASGSSTTLVAGALAVRGGRPVLMVVAHLDDADDALEDLALFRAAGYELSACRFGALEMLPGESNVSLELLAERLAVVEQIVRGQRFGGSSANPFVLIAPVQALMQAVPEPQALGDFSRTITPGCRLDPGELLDWLDRAGYQRADAIEQPGDFAPRGGIIDIYLPSGGAVLAEGAAREPEGDAGTGFGPTPVRLDFFGDEVESICLVDPDTMGSGRRLSRVQVVGSSLNRLQSDERTTSLMRLLPRDTLVVLSEVLEIAEQARGYYERLTNPRGIYAPQAVLKELTARPHVQVSQFGSGAAQEDVLRLPVRNLMSFDHDAAKAVAELAELAGVGPTPGGAVTSSTSPSGRGRPGAAEPGEGPANVGGKGAPAPGVSAAICDAATTNAPRSAAFPSPGGSPNSPPPSPARGEGTASVVVLCQKPAEEQRLRELIQEHAPQAVGRIQVEVGYLHRGFVWEAATHEVTRSRSDQVPNAPSDSATPSLRHSVTLSLRHLCLYLIPHHELFHRYLTRRRIRRLSVAAVGEGGAEAFLDLEPGDHVVHVEHGIARFVGLKTMRQRGATEDYLTLAFAKGSLLHVPATQIELIQKYIGGFQGTPPLSLLGGKRWDKQKEAAAEAVKDLAAEMLRIQAARAALPGVRYPPDTAWQHEFEAEFPYEETDDQLAAIAEMKKNMADEQPMDRLICGDVGFGKTEIAIRGAFKAAEYGKQVAVLVPTTVLAEQHERTFRERMTEYPFRIESISRFKTGKQQDQTLSDLAQGRIDVIIGTHRLLSGDVKFADLGLVIIDEEQRFGVEHKQRLLQFRLTVDVLTLTATPIPRTLHMSMLGLRDISSLSTPPMDRRAIVTEVIPYDDERVRHAILRELNRDGQVFFVHNRVHNIESIAAGVQSLVPEARIAVGHGQMPGHELEEVMLRFVRRQADILVCTTIIESGLDIPTANTIFINEADHFGLADLHQLRGRVGRYKHRAYCYLILPGDRPITEKAQRRLRAIEQYSMLGAGFKIAMRDLEIRGAGNLLGAEQSGHIAAVGYQMYCTLLDQEAKRLRNEKIIEPVHTHLELPVIGRLPPQYIASDKHRMEAYRRLSRAKTLEQLDAVAKDLADAYGKPPALVQALLDLTELRIAASTLDIAGIKLDGPDVIFRTPHPRNLDELLKEAPGRASLIDERTVYYRPPANYLEPATLLAVLRKLIVRPVRGRQAAMTSA